MTEVRRNKHVAQYNEEPIEDKRLYVVRRHPYRGIKLTKEEEDWLMVLRTQLFHSDHSEHSKVELPKDAAVSLFRCLVSLGEKVVAAQFGYDPPDDYNEIAACWKASYEKAAAATPEVTIPRGLVAHV